MWWLLSIVFVAQALNPVLFFDDFENRNLPGWRISNNVGVEVKRSELVMGKDADIDINVPGAEDWTDYTVILRFRMAETGEQSQFIINVRFHIGRFNIFTSQSVNIFPHEQTIMVWTIRPEEHPDDRPIDRANIKHALELGKWYLLAIETLNSDFKIFLDDRQLLSYRDPETLPGTVNLSIGPFGTTKVGIDYIKIAQEGYEGYSVSTQGKLATTWGQIKNIWEQLNYP